MGKIELTKEQEEAIDQTFRYFDYANEGKIIVAELKTVVRALGQNPTEQELDEMRREIDPSESGTFTLEQFKELMSGGWLKDFSELEEELREAFQHFDKSGDGYISITELRYALMKTGDTMADDELGEMMKLVDVDGDGRISYEEFIKWFTAGRINLV